MEPIVHLWISTNVANCCGLSYEEIERAGERVTSEVQYVTCPWYHQSEIPGHRTPISIGKQYRVYFVGGQAWAVQSFKEIYYYDRGVPVYLVTASGAIINWSNVTGVCPSTSIQNESETKSE